jgi:threonine synthase
VKNRSRDSEPDSKIAVDLGGMVPILDGATAQATQLPSELDAEAKIARDPNRSLDERLEAFENVFESEVGDTRLARARNIERETGMRQLYLKFDGGNPTGTQKDRIAFAQAMDALRRGFDTVTAATCGNYGAALALAASFAGLRCKVYVPAGYQVRRAPEIENYGAEIEAVPGDYEAAVERSRVEAAEREFYDANPGGANTMIQLRAYGEIAYEIYDELRDAPAAVAIPVSNGTTLAGVFRGFQSLYRRGKTSRMPRIIAGSSYQKNPIVQSFLSGAENCQDLDPAKQQSTNHSSIGTRSTATWRSRRCARRTAGPRTLRIGRCPNIRA